MPQTQAPRQVFVKREVCRPAGYPVIQQQMPGRHLVKEIIRQIPQTSAAQPAMICMPQQSTVAQPTFVCLPQQQQPTAQSQTAQPLVPVFATQQVRFLCLEKNI